MHTLTTGFICSILCTAGVSLFFLVQSLISFFCFVYYVHRLSIVIMFYVLSKYFNCSYFNLFYVNYVVDFIHKKNRLGTLERSWNLNLRMKWNKYANLFVIEKCKIKFVLNFFFLCCRCASSHWNQFILMHCNYFSCWMNFVKSFCWFRLA